MTWSNFLEKIAAFMDWHLPWLLPSLEAVEQSFPLAGRLFVCLLLTTWLVLSRHGRQAQTAVS